MPHLLHYRVEKQRAALQEKIAAAQQQKVAVSTTTATVVTTASGKTTEELKAQMEAQLKQQRLAMQQKRLAEAQQAAGQTPTTVGTRTILASGDQKGATTVIQLSSLQPQQKTMLITSGNSKSPVSVGTPLSSS